MIRAYSTSPAVHLNRAEQVEMLPIQADFPELYGPIYGIRERRNGAFQRERHVVSRATPSECNDLSERIWLIRMALKIAHRVDTQSATVSA
jgi:hypothetical protein